MDESAATFFTSSLIIDDSDKIMSALHIGNFGNESLVSATDMIIDGVATIIVVPHITVSIPHMIIDGTPAIMFASPTIISVMEMIIGAMEMIIGAMEIIISDASYLFFKSAS